MKRSKSLWGASLAVAGAVLFVGCGRGDEPSAATARSPGGTEQAAAPDVAARGAPSTPSAVETCIELADRQAWGEALDPCTRAAQERPDDLRIRHALQQAQAAASVRAD